MVESLPRARLVVERCPPSGHRVALSRGEAAHARARRLLRGDAVILLDGTGVEARGILARLTGEAGEVLVEEILPATRPAPTIAVFVAGLRAERLSWLAEKATELEASRLVIVETHRTQRFRATAGLIARLERVIREAAKQCGAPRWPSIGGPRTLQRVLGEESPGSRLFLDFGAAPFPLKLEAPVTILVGPEGGWTDSERAAARAAGWSPVSLAGRKLRAETAALAALVLARAALAREP